MIFLPHRKPKLWLGLYILLLNHAVMAQEPSATTEEPETLIFSDTLRYDDINSTTVFTGNVVLTRGFFQLRSDHLTMTEDDAGYRFLVATMETTPPQTIPQTDSAALVSTTPQAHLVQLIEEDLENYELFRAQGLKAEYDDKSEILTMTGQATVTRYICGKAMDNVRGEQVVYSSKNKTYHAVNQAHLGQASPHNTTAVHHDYPTQRVRSLVQPSSRIDAAIEACRQQYQGQPMPSQLETPTH